MNALEPHAGFATAEDWSRFLRPLLAVIRGAPSQEEYAVRCAAIAFALPETPRAMLNTPRQRDAMRRFQFLPTPAEIDEWMRADLADWRRLATYRAPVQRAEPPAQRTPAEVEAARQFVAAMKAEVAALDPPRRRLGPIQPRHLSPDDLRLAREQAGIVIREPAA